MESEEEINLIREKIIKDMEQLHEELKTIYFKLGANKALLDLIDSIK